MSREAAAARRGSGIVLDFLGATETVTGSRFLITTPRARVLVDCGLYQGMKALRERNWQPLPIDAASIDAVVLTHAHVDHSGFLPRLEREGFRGQIYATARTGELCRIVLPDCGHLQEEQAEYANERGFTKHSPAQPLYTQHDAQAVLARFADVPYRQAVPVADGVRATFRPAGHILGSASVALQVDGAGERSVVFSGDLGRSSHPLLRPPDPLGLAHTVAIESTYGAREHVDGDAEARLGEAIGRAIERGGVVVIPAFAVDRTEIILFHLRRLIASGQLPELPVYVDSPMALASLAVYRRAAQEGDEELRPELRGNPQAFRPEGLIEARDVEASKAIHDVHEPALIVSASGMASGGRVLHHLARRLPDPRNIVVFVGFQAAGTRGRHLVDGAREVKLLGRHIPVRAEIVDLSAFSVHADQSDLLQWLGTAEVEPECVYVIHGEREGSAALRNAIEQKLGWCAVVPHYRERVLALPSSAGKR